MIAIRPLATSDRDRWEQLFAAYANFYNTEVSEGVNESVWGWIYDPSNDFWCALAVQDDEQIVGFVQYQLMHRSLSGAMVCYLSDLYVEPASRGSGAGRALIDHVVAFARDRGISNVRWLTQEHNYSARRLYDTYQPKSDFILYSLPIEQA